MNRRALEQLRRRRMKVTIPTGVPTLPDNVAGVPFVITDSLSKCGSVMRLVAAVCGLIPTSAIEGQRPGHMPAQGSALGLHR